jgi:hypothetical protein
MGKTIQAATAFWIEAGAMSGGARNQIELTDELVHFFDPTSLAAERCDIRLPTGKFAFGRPAKHRGRRYGQWVDIWRIGLPTAAQGGPKYPGSVIRLDRVKTKGRSVYEMSVTSPDSVVFHQWLAAAKASGTTSRTGGPSGRRFGYF